jgi:hypothetical protein
MSASTGSMQVRAGARLAKVGGPRSARNARQGQKQGNGVIPLADKDLRMSPFFGEFVKGANQTAAWGCACRHFFETKSTQADADRA